MRLLLEVTQNLVEGARAVDYVTSPSSASPSPPSNQSQSSRVWAAEWSTSCSARRANRCVGSSFELGGKREFHSHALPLMRMSAACACFGRTAVPLVTTSISTTSLAGFLTFSWAAGTAVRSRAQQQKVVCRALNPRDPSTIIPNTPTPAHALSVRPNPPLTLAGRLLHTPAGAATMEAAGRAARPKDLFILRGAGGQVVGRGGGDGGRFFRGSEAFYDVRFAFFCSQAPETGVGDNARTWTDAL